MKQAVILAGGKGTRLAERLHGLPKPLVDVDGVPLLERQLRQLAAAGFTDALILVSHRRDAIETFCAERVIPGLTVSVRDDGAEPRGTAGAVYEARERLSETFLVVYGDTLFDIDLERFWSAHRAGRAQGVEGTLFLHPNDHPHDSDLVETRDDGRIVAFHPKPHAEGVWRRNLVNAALYVLDKRLVISCPPGMGVVDYGRDLFPKAVAAGHKLNGYATYEYIKDLGTPKRLDRVVADLRSGKVARARLSSPQRAVFLDRDGTLNLPAGHIATPKALTLAPGAAEAVRKLNQAEYRCVLVTNQPVIARGECTTEELGRIHAKLETLLGDHGAFLDATYYCPHHPHAGYPGEVAELKIACACRKPEPGMILQAAKDLSIDLKRSWMVGDSAADIGAARAAGVRSVLVRSGGVTATDLDAQPDYEVEDIGDAARLICAGAATAREALAPWLERIRPGMMVRIAGQSRSGKSVLAAALREALAEREIVATHLRLDHWTKSADMRPAVGGVAARYDLAALDAALAKWTAGDALDVAAPRYDPIKRAARADGPRFVAPPDGVVIVEGVLAAKIAAGSRSTLTLFATLPETIRRARFIRAYKQRGLIDAEAEKLYLARLRDEFGMIEDGRAAADGVIAAPLIERVYR